jgi:hypothetical protein
MDDTLSSAAMLVDDHRLLVIAAWERVSDAKLDSAFSVSITLPPVGVTVMIQCGSAAWLDASSP